MSRRSDPPDAAPGAKRRDRPTEGLRLDRRDFVLRAAGGGVGLLLPGALLSSSLLAPLAANPARAEDEATASTSARAEDGAAASTSARAERPSEALLRKSPYVYVCPLRADGSESRCHGEVWYAWLDDSVVVTVAADRWKARALARGLDRARIWVGDHGRWRTWLGGTNEAFRQAPRFEVRASRVPEAERGPLFERLIAAYEVKYPEEIADWRDRMRQGQADGSRILIRYRPLGG